MPQLIWLLQIVNSSNFGNYNNYYYYIYILEIRNVHICHIPVCSTYAVLNDQLAHFQPSGLKIPFFPYTSISITSFVHQPLTHTIADCAYICDEARGHSIVTSPYIPKHNYILEHAAHARYYFRPSRAQTRTPDWLTQATTNGHSRALHAIYFHYLTFNC